MNRKSFLQLGSSLAATATLQHLLPAFPYSKKRLIDAVKMDFVWDGILLSPLEYATLLMQLADEGKIKADYYSNGGVVEELEHQFATLLGTESSVWMPTGTLANHIAIRHLAGDNRRVIVQEQSHVYNDTGDSAQSLSNLNLISLGKNEVGFTLDEVKEIAEKTLHGRVETHIGVMSIETPVRRQHDRMVPFDDLKTLTGYAHENGIKTHLDGARLFVQSVHTDSSPVQYATLFDTTYISMWKFFNAASGAILAGTKAFTEKLFHERRMFGGGLPAAWPFAAVALHYSNSFLNDYTMAWKKAQELFSALESTGRFHVTSFPNGSHVVRLEIIGVNLTKFKDALFQKNIELPNPDDTGFFLKVNTTMNRMSVAYLVDAFSKAVKEAE
jgi:threonine aldolase